MGRLTKQGIKKSGKGEEMYENETKTKKIV